MRFSMNKILAIAVILAMVIIAVVFILAEIGSQQPSSSPETGTETGEAESTAYPDNLLEGVIASIGGPASFVMEADIAKIEGLAGEGKMMKTIKITSETIIVVYNLLGKAEVPVSIGELEVGDNVVVATQESTKNDVLTREEFTATKVSKMVSPVQPTP